MTLNIIYQDPHLIVVDKPAGLVVTPTEIQTDPTLADILTKDFGIKLERGGVVHRLDKDTSGVIVVAKTLEAFENLQAQFKERNVKKQYLALVHGNLKEETTVDAPIGRNPLNREKFTIMPDGKPALTRFLPVDSLCLADGELSNLYPDFSKIQMRKLKNLNYQEYSLVECFPFTGRTHQIRVHLKYINLPIVGDDKYGGRRVSRLDNRWCPRQFLHAVKINFKHPVSGESLEFVSPVPADLSKALNYLSKT